MVLTEDTKVLSPFIPGTNYQWAWDSTSLGWVKECPRKYYYNMICGWIGRGESVHLEFGVLYHTGLERYDILISKGESHDQALRHIVKMLLVLTWREGKPWRAAKDLPIEDKS